MRFGDVFDPHLAGALDHFRRNGAHACEHGKVAARATMARAG
jgi:hypothetical protein